MRNILAGWAKTGLSPWNPSRVLSTLNAPPQRQTAEAVPIIDLQLSSQEESRTTPQTAEAVACLRSKIEAQIQHLDEELQHDIRRISEAAAIATSSRDLYREEAHHVRQQNQHNARRQGTNFDAGLACVMDYDALNKLWEKKKKEKETKGTERAQKAAQRPKKLKDGTYATIQDELDGGRLEIKALGLTAYCHVLRF